VGGCPVVEISNGGSRGSLTAFGWSFFDTVTQFGRLVFGVFDGSCALG